MTTYYKVLVDNKSCHGGDFDWTDYLPTVDGPGQWTPEITNVRVCKNGWHLTTDPMQWSKVGMQVYRAEGIGKAKVKDDKAAFPSVRLIESVDHIIPDWWRKIEAFVAELTTIPWLTPQIDTLPDQINGVPIRLFDTRFAARHEALDADPDAARNVALDAARVAALNAARNAAQAAAHAAAHAAALDAAWDAALDASWAAALAAARDAAWDAELSASILVCDGLPLDQEHIAYAEARMQVWKLGYGVVCDVAGTLFAYRRLK